MSISEPNRSVQLRQATLFGPPNAYSADPCASRHGGAETSREAHKKVLPHKREIYERLLAIVQDRGAEGATVHELAEALETFPSSISGRLTELRILGRLTYLLDAQGRKVKRGGACALIAAAGLP